MTESRGVRMGWGAALAATLVAAWFAPAPQEEGVALTSRAAHVGQHPSPYIQENTSAEMKWQTGGQPTDSGARSEEQRNREKSPALVQVLRIRERGDFENEEASVFAKASWGLPASAMNVPPLDPLPVQAAPAPPTAPALPFRVMGRYEEDGNSVVFLLQADKSWVVREGETFAETYKVERIASNAIHLRYLPLNEVQVLEIGAAP